MKRQDDDQRERATPDGGTLRRRRPFYARGYVPGLAVAVRAWRTARRLLSRNEWSLRLLGLPVSQGTDEEPGLILVQIDGLARHQFERALGAGRMPFLRRLTRQGYQLHSLYSGLPASTPAVQGELLYGVKTAVPAFGFRDPSSGDVDVMFNPSMAQRVEERLRASGPGLLTGGSVYSCIYTGGAAEPHFCAASLGWGNLLRNVPPLAVLIVALWHAGVVFRTLGLIFLEWLLVVLDACRGLHRWRTLWDELLGVPSRVAITVLLRDLITIGAALDAVRGLPIVMVNYLGYDEHAHRSSPDGRIAHWTLTGIDRSIRRIWMAARRSRYRDYQLWVFSDHGQESTVSYEEQHGRTLDEAVRAVFRDQELVTTVARRKQRGGVGWQRASWLGGSRLQKFLGGGWGVSASNPSPELAVAGVGPLGHVYLKEPMPVHERAEFAEKLVREAQVPVVFCFQSDEELWVFTGAGRFRLPHQAASVFGAAHPFLAQIAADIRDVCRHADAGDFVLSGWTPHGPHISFPRENGAHGSTGTEETHAFLFLPPDVSLPAGEATVLRPVHLRAAVNHALGREHLPLSACRLPSKRPPGRVRVVTYNVHSCIGTDGKITPARVARLLRQYEPDIVALQELDVGRGRTRGVDQVRHIAETLGMESLFYPAIRLKQEQYGNAILSRFPLRLIQAAALPRLAGHSYLEPRGAILAEVDTDGVRLQILTTHLGLLGQERLIQVEALLGPQWLLHPSRQGPLVLCGDFNALPRSSAYRLLARSLRDVQVGLRGHRPRRTWFSHFPLARVDHIFVTRDVQVLAVQVPRSELSTKASDHLPVIADLQIVPAKANAAAQQVPSPIHEESLRAS